MARIKIADLPEDQKISREEMKKVTGGLLIKPIFFGLQLSPFPKPHEPLKT